MKKIIQAVKGTRDFYPEKLALRNFIYRKARETSELFGYQEWDGPFIEPLDLYAAKSGEELVKKQSFVFEDRGGDPVALRPELTPSLARMIAARQNELVYPVRWWSFGPFWRYEQPQKGRTREFFQWNVDMLGVDSPEADAELIAVAATFLRSVGLEAQRARVFVNNRKMMDAQFDRLEIPQTKRVDVSNLIDRRSKMEPVKWDEYGLEIGLKQNQVEELKKILGDFSLWQKSEELVRLFDALNAMGVSDYVQYDPNIMRGLLYYTGTVFEAYDVSGSLKRAVLGGGRYNNLLEDVGGEQLSAVGFAMGDVVLGIILEESGLVPEFNPSSAPVLITIFNENLARRTYTIAAVLRNAGINTQVYPETAKIQKQFKYADKMKVRLVLTIGPEEEEKGQVAIKDLLNGSQVTVPAAELVERVRQMLESR